MLRSAFLRKKKKMPSSSQSSGAHGVSDYHLAMEEELPHPSRNLTVSRVVIMVYIYILYLHIIVSLLSDALLFVDCGLGFVKILALHSSDSHVLFLVSL